MWLTLYVVKDGCSCGSKARHGFKEGIGEAWDMSAKPIGETPEKGKSYPARRDGDVAVAS